jgi:hypothetical protein
MSAIFRMSEHVLLYITRLIDIYYSLSLKRIHHRSINQNESILLLSIPHTFCARCCCCAHNSQHRQLYHPTNLPIGAILNVVIQNNASNVNLMSEIVILELNQLVTSLQNDTSTKVVLFKSGNPTFFAAHFDVIPRPG